MVRSSSIPFLVFFLAFLLTALVHPAPIAFVRTVGAGPTVVSGTLTENTTWNLSASPYIVTGDVTVPAGITLTVDPGVEVRFDTAPPASHLIVVFGTLRAVGEPRPGGRIVFTSNDPFPDRNDWVSIQFQRSVGSIVEWAEFSWGSTTLDIRQCSPRIANNTILDSGLRAIQVIGPDAEPVIEDNTIRTQFLAENRTFNQRTGIITQDANPVIRNNTLTDNYVGIFVYLGGQPRISDNTIRNGWVGLMVVSSSPIVERNLIEGNGLANYGGTGILLSFSAATLVDNVIRNNGVGIELPYDSKETLPLSRGNVVNGVPIETMYRYRVRDLVIDRLDLDSGHSLGFTGNATQEGLLTVYDSVNVTVRRAILRNNGALVFAANSTATVENSTLMNSSNEFLLKGVSQVFSLNTAFHLDAVNITDERSSVTIRNFLHVRTTTEASVPIAGVDVRVIQDGAETARRKTDSMGQTAWIPATYGVLSSVGGTERAPTLSLSQVEVSVAAPPSEFAGTPRGVNMSITHTETFLQTDKTRPRVDDTIPSADSVGVRLGSRIVIVFSEPMNQSATAGAIEVVGYHIGDLEWSADGRSVSFLILDARFGETYFVSIRDTAMDLSGNRLSTTYVFAFDIEHAPRRVDLAPVWAASLAILVAGLLAVWWRSRAGAKALREEQGDGGQQRKE